jgi:hypothetical protein
VGFTSGCSTAGRRRLPIKTPPWPSSRRTGEEVPGTVSDSSRHPLPLCAEIYSWGEERKPLSAPVLHLALGGAELATNSAPPPTPGRGRSPLPTVIPSPRGVLCPGGFCVWLATVRASTATRRTACRWANTRTPTRRGKEAPERVATRSVRPHPLPRRPPPSPGGEEGFFSTAGSGGDGGGGSRRGRDFSSCCLSTGAGYGRGRDTGNT